MVVSWSVPVAVSLLQTTSVVVVGGCVSGEGEEVGCLCIHYLLQIFEGGRDDYSVQRALALVPLAVVLVYCLEESKQYHHRGETGVVGTLELVDEGTFA